MYYETGQAANGDSVCGAWGGRKTVCVLEGRLVAGTRVSGADANDKSAAV